MSNLPINLLIHFKAGLLASICISSPDFSFAGTADTGYTEHQYFIFFKDKKFSYSKEAGVASHFSAASIERRKRQNIAFDEYDEPVSDMYLDNMRKDGVNIRYVSRWLNGALVGVREKEIANRQKLRFYVEKVVYVGEIKRNPGLSENEKLNDDFEKLKISKPYKDIYGDSRYQNEMLGTVILHQKGYTGKGVNIAVLDAGFFKANRLPAFDKAFNDGRIKFSYDFVDDEKDVYDDDDHGLHVLSCMAAYSPGKMIGTAPDANYFLFRTEIAATESLLEEINWVIAAEMADSLGIDIINSSLGYTTFDDKRMDHTHADLDGKSTFISKGASIAASRGILVVNAAGNDGNDKWRKIGVPADVETVLSVGAVDEFGIIAPFSSAGPTATGKIKPDVCALGYLTTVASSYGTFYPGNGTSYAAPLLCGGIACLYQASKNVSPQKMLYAVQKSGDKCLSPDSLYGYGVPNLNLGFVFAGISPVFDYRNKALVASLPDTTNGLLRIDAFGKDDDWCLIEVYRKKKFLLFFSREKRLYSETKKYDNEGFATGIYTFNKPSHRGTYKAVVYSKSKSGNKEKLASGYFYNLPAILH